MSMTKTLNLPVMIHSNFKMKNSPPPTFGVITGIVKKNTDKILGKFYP